MKLSLKSKPTRPPVPRRVPRRILRPLHARAAVREECDEYDEGESEPNMKFSHALIVVLILHVLAVGGVIAFNMLKPGQAGPSKKAPVAESPGDSAPGGAVANPPGKTEAKQPAAVVAGLTHTVVAGDTLRKIASLHKTSVEAIQEASGLEATSILHIGQVIALPSKASARPASPKEAAPAAKKPEAKPAPAATAKEAPAAPKVSAPSVVSAPAKPAQATTPAVAAKANPAVAAKSEPAPAAPVVAKAPVSSPAKAAAPVAAKDSEATSEPAAAKTTGADSSPNSTEKSTESQAHKPAAEKGTYTVAKGDNPYLIAKKLKISYSELIKANHVTDPKKLQIGQK